MLDDEIEITDPLPLSIEALQKISQEISEDNDLFSPSQNNKTEEPLIFLSATSPLALQHVNTVLAVIWPVKEKVWNGVFSPEVVRYRVLQMIHALREDASNYQSILEIYHGYLYAFIVLTPPEVWIENEKVLLAIQALFPEKREIITACRKEWLCAQQPLEPPALADSMACIKAGIGKIDDPTLQRMITLLTAIYPTYTNDISKTVDLAVRHAVRDMVQWLEETKNKAFRVFPYHFYDYAYCFELIIQKARYQRALNKAVESISNNYQQTVTVLERLHQEMANANLIDNKLPFFQEIVQMVTALNKAIKENRPYDTILKEHIIRMHLDKTTARLKAVIVAASRRFDRLPRTGLTELALEIAVFRCSLPRDSSSRAINLLVQVLFELYNQVQADIEQEIYGCGQWVWQSGDSENRYCSPATEAMMVAIDTTLLLRVLGDAVSPASAKTAALKIYATKYQAMYQKAHAEHPYIKNFLKSIGVIIFATIGLIGTPVLAIYARDLAKFLTGMLPNDSSMKGLLFSPPLLLSKTKQIATLLAPPVIKPSSGLFYSFNCCGYGKPHEALIEREPLIGRSDRTSSFTLR